MAKTRTQTIAHFVNEFEDGLKIVSLRKDETYIETDPTFSPITRITNIQLELTEQTAKDFFISAGKYMVTITKVP
jgi:hypothetical protein